MKRYTPFTISREGIRCIPMYGMKCTVPFPQQTGKVYADSTYTVMKCYPMTKSRVSPAPCWSLLPVADFPDNPADRDKNNHEQKQNPHNSRLTKTAQECIFQYAGIASPRTLSGVLPVEELHQRRNDKPGNDPRKNAVKKSCHSLGGRRGLALAAAFLAPLCHTVIPPLLCSQGLFCPSDSIHCSTLTCIMQYGILYKLTCLYLYNITH